MRASWSGRQCSTSFEAEAIRVLMKTAASRICTTWPACGYVQTYKAWVDELTEHHLIAAFVWDLALHDALGYRSLRRSSNRVLSILRIALQWASTRALKANRQVLFGEDLDCILPTLRLPACALPAGHFFILVVHHVVQTFSTHEAPLKLVSADCLTLCLPVARRVALDVILAHQTTSSKVCHQAAKW